MRDFSQRLFDIALSVIGLTFTWPIIVAMAGLLRLESPGNPFFVQTRIGRHGRPFRLIKMRTLFSDQFGIDINRELDPASPRITRIGRLLRRSKLDELPQLVNVLRGEMSIVGPRPDIPEQVEQYDDAQRDRLRVRPGLTGAAQVCGNTAMSWPQRIRIDNWYIDQRSLVLDLKILFWTIVAVLVGERAIVNRLNIPNQLFEPCSADLAVSNDSSSFESAECAS